MLINIVQKYEIIPIMMKDEGRKVEENAENIAFWLLFVINSC